MKLNRNHIIMFAAAGLAALLLVVTYLTREAGAPSAAAGGTGLDVSQLSGRIGYEMGALDAPVKMVEFASLTCPHCKSFKENIFPQLQRDYIDTGKVRYYYRHFPLDTRAFAAALQVDCLPVNARPAAVNALFARQAAWAAAQNPAAALFSILRQFGVTREGFNQCLEDQESLDRINAEVSLARDFGVSGTPYFFVNGEALTGVRDYAVLASAVDAALASQRQ